MIVAVLVLRESGDCMKIGIWTSDLALAKETITQLEKTELGKVLCRHCCVSEMMVMDDQGNSIQWIRPCENARGYKIDKAYVDIRVNTDILFTIILPCLWHGGFEDIVWIADRRTTVYEYLCDLPQPLFEATLLGLMGFQLDPEKESWFHEWMERPYGDVFPMCNLSSLRNSTTILLDHMSMLLGKTASMLPVEKQTQLKDAMKNYCEVCDYINNHATNIQK